VENSRGEVVGRCEVLLRGDVARDHTLAYTIATDFERNRHADEPTLPSKSRSTPGQTRRRSWIDSRDIVTDAMRRGRACRIYKTIGYGVERYPQQLYGSVTTYDVGWHRRIERSVVYGADNAKPRPVREVV
jgi:hypothetical protein